MHALTCMDKPWDPSAKLVSREIFVILYWYKDFVATRICFTDKRRKGSCTWQLLKKIYYVCKHTCPFLFQYQLFSKPQISLYRFKECHIKDSIFKCLKCCCSKLESLTCVGLCWHAYILILWARFIHLHMPNCYNVSHWCVGSMNVAWITLHGKC